MPIEHANSNLFLNTARFYDIDCRRHRVYEDLPLYRDLATQQGSPVLELACGTGRVTLDLLAHGQEVWGIDASPAMLDRLKEKAAHLPEETQRRLHVAQGDMRQFDLGRRFQLILIPYRSFQALTAIEDVHACLKCVRQHLASGGLFVFDILREDALAQAVPRRVELPDWQEAIPSHGMLTRTNRLLGFDRENRVFSLEHIYRLQDSEGAVHEFIDRLDLRAYSVEEVESMLLAHRFKIRQRLGDYYGRSLGGADDWIFIVE